MRPSLAEIRADIAQVERIIVTLPTEEDRRAGRTVVAALMRRTVEARGLT